MIQVYDGSSRPLCASIRQCGRILWAVCPLCMEQLYIFDTVTARWHCENEECDRKGLIITAGGDVGNYCYISIDDILSVEEWVGLWLKVPTSSITVWILY